MRFRHNKKRNPAFIFEALTREFAKATLNKDTTYGQKIRKVIKEVFNKNKLMHKELKLYKAILETREVDFITAEKILFEVRRAYSTFNNKELHDEHTEAIHAINHELTPSVFQNYVSNYKSLATAYQIFHEDDVNVKNKVLLEKKIVQSMVVKKVSDLEAEEPLDEVVVKTFIKKFNKTFGALLSEQKTLISKYMGSIDADNTELLIFINEELGRLKETIKESLTIEEFESDKEMSQKAVKLLKILEGFKDKREYKKEDLIMLLKTQELVKEIQQ
tara:strand:+ start:1018 stop:1842 length:825 start_codon:yes stop_codon:yes gene_type:complete